MNDQAPEYLQGNVDFWQKEAAKYAEYGEDAWASDQPAWAEGHSAGVGPDMVSLPDRHIPARGDRHVRALLGSVITRSFHRYNPDDDLLGARGRGPLCSDGRWTVSSKPLFGITRKGVPHNLLRAGPIPLDGFPSPD